MRVTIKDIAKKCGLSNATVGNILSKSNRYSFKQETVDLVWQTAKEMNYRPNPLASNLRKQENRIILCIVGWACRHSDIAQLKALEHEIGKHGYNMVIQFIVDLPDEQKLKFIKNLINWPAGIIIADLGIRDPEILKKAVKLFQSAPPTVALFAQYKGSNVDYLRIDWQTERHELVQYLKTKNITSVLFCCTEREKKLFSKVFEYAENEGIEAGYLTTKALADIPHYFKMGQILGEELLKMEKMPDALYCISDEMAFSIIEVIRKAGVRVPEDILIVGGGDSEFCQWQNPPMPILIHDVEAIAAEAADYLINRIVSGAQNVGSGTCFYVGIQRMKIPEKLNPR